MINIDAVGAGELTVFTREGIINSRRADRRMVRSLARTAADLHISLAQAEHEWGSTDATPSMRAHVRSITISGVDPSGMKALSGTPADVIERVNPGGRPRDRDDSQVLVAALLARPVTPTAPAHPRASAVFLLPWPPSPSAGRCLPKSRSSRRGTSFLGICFDA